MIKFILDKISFYKVILSVLPLTVFCLTLKDGLTVGAAAFIIIIISALLTPLIYKYLSSKTAFAAKILIASALSGLLFILLNLFLPQMAENLGVYMPLVAICAVIASVNEKPVTFKTYISGQFFFGITSFLLLTLISLIREFLGAGSFFGFDLFSKWFEPIAFFSTSAGALLTVAVFVIVYQAIISRVKKGEEDKK